MAARLITSAIGTVVTGGTRVQLVAAPIKAVTAFITAGASAVTVGDNTVTATKGIIIPAGTTLRLDAVSMEELALDAMWVDGTSGATFNVSYLSKV